jgi:hypothetical protein
MDHIVDEIEESLDFDKERYVGPEDPSHNFACGLYGALGPTALL